MSTEARENSEQQTASLRIYGGLFLLALSTLMYEVLLTRIFSVTTWYHFAFLAISMALFGMTLGAIGVYLRPDIFTADRLPKHLALGSLMFAVLSVLAIVVHLSCPYILNGLDGDTVLSLSLLCTLPFTLTGFAASGVSVSLVLTRFPRQTNTLYAADLLGAGLGCILLVLSLRFADALADVLLIAALAALAGACFSVSSKERKVFGCCLTTAAILLGLGLWQANSYLNQKSLVGINWSKGRWEEPKLYELWNSFSRIRIYGDPNTEKLWIHPGMSKKTGREVTSKYLTLDIDGGAGTSILHYEGKPERLNYLRNDVCNLAYRLKTGGNTLVIGAGGGKDILSALVTGQRHVTAVEINDNTINTVYRVFADFGGHLLDDPRVSVVNDEARSFITRSHDKFDIIQISMIDTWAATASGAYSLSENGIYTTDAWKILINHLTDDGILTVSRWYSHTIPAEFYRLTALAAAALKECGISNPSEHIVILRVRPSKDDQFPDSIGTLLLSKKPLDREAIRKMSSDTGFELVYSGTDCSDPVIGVLAQGGDPAVVAANVPFNLKAPTDDNPFFFQMIRLSHLFDARVADRNMNVSNALAGLMLLVVGACTLVFSAYCIRIPYLMTKDRESMQGAFSLLLYFAAIGSGFMFVEISQISRLSIYLGHPVYGLCVVLCSLLVATGFGSLCCEQLPVLKRCNEKWIIGSILVVLAAYGLASGPLLDATQQCDAPMRMLVTTALLLPVGLVLGTAFPIGMKAAFRTNAALTPWLWGINGAFSVCMSVVALIVAMFGSISISYCFGLISYIVALVALSRVHSTNS